MLAGLADRMRCWATCVGTYPNAHCNVVSKRKSQKQVRNFHSRNTQLPGYSNQRSASAYTLIPRTIHALAFFRLSCKTSQGFCAILSPNFIQGGPVVEHCQIFDVGMSILASRTDLSCPVNSMPCQRFAPIVYQAPLLVQHFQSPRSTPNTHTTFLEGPVTCNSLPSMSESSRYSCSSARTVVFFLFYRLNNKWLRKQLWHEFIMHFFYIMQLLPHRPTHSLYSSVHSTSSICIIIQTKNLSNPNTGVWGDYEFCI